MIVGSNSLAGVIALTFYSVGYLAKFFSETFESTDLSSQEALNPWGQALCRPFSMASGLMPVLLSGVIAYGCWNTMFVPPVSLVMSELVVSDYTLNLR